MESATINVSGRLRVVRVIIALSRQAVATYIAREGAHCPVCAGLGLGRVRAPVTCSPGAGIRHHLCPQCGVTFKSIEDLVAAAAVRITETVSTKPKRRDTQARKR
jgi:hypothetical protein